MKCSKCNGETKIEKFKGIEIDRCLNCKSIWLDYNELDQLEDTVLSDDELKGSLFFGTKPSSIVCPKCGTTMKVINYRFNDLELEVCPDSCGFYLDADEEKRILELMKNDKEAIKRKISAEEEWGKSLGRIKTKSFMDKVKSFLKK
ncbi:MAG: zf-TFIIB domain-containing protein [Bacteroidetes bacterium]|nr:zf-TFIIB domain-containing protein [Bacteroidota bacterium]